MVKTTVLNTFHELAELPQAPIATYPVDRKNKILSTSQPPGETTSKLLLVT
jgi:hypothetical protein